MEETKTALLASETPSFRSCCWGLMRIMMVYLNQKNYIVSRFGAVITAQHAGINGNHL
jgi:hypothetical protein